MATYSDVFSARPYTLILTVALNTQDNANNRSSYNYSVSVKSNSGNGSWVSDSQDATVVINGTTYTETGSMDFRPDSSGKTKTIGSGTTGWITHASDGTKTFNVRAYMSSIPVFGTADTGTQTYTAVRIPKPPAAPGTPTLTAVTPTSVKATWTAPTNNNGAAVTGYQVQLATNSAFTTGVQTFTTTALTYTPTGLTPGTDYYVRVRAQNSMGYGSYSAYSTAKTLSGMYVRRGTEWRSTEVLAYHSGAFKTGEVNVYRSGAWVLAS